MSKDSNVAIGNDEYEAFIIAKSSKLRDHILGYVSNTGLVIWLLSYSLDNGSLVLPGWQIVISAFSGKN